MSMVINDLETTGGRVTSDRVTEVGLIEVRNGEITDEWQTLVNPQAWISPFIERHTGITNEMVAGAPLFDDIDLLSAAVTKVMAKQSLPFAQLEIVDLNGIGKPHSDSLQ